MNDQTKFFSGEELKFLSHIVNEYYIWECVRKAWKQSEVLKFRKIGLSWNKSRKMAKEINPVFPMPLPKQIWEAAYKADERGSNPIQRFNSALNAAMNDKFDPSIKGPVAKTPGLTACARCELLNKFGLSEEN